MAAMVLSVSLVFAQTPLPLNPAVKHGQLPNGLNYYILHNEQPKERANFYIAQKVGSTLETPEQLGLAHFLEHMAFNGTEHFPGKTMLNYLQSKGIRFGADINASTGFDETIYNINNVPTTDVALMDSVLLVLRDWSGSILLEDSEIVAERGVIEEEWRMRNDAMIRMLSSTLPQLFDEYQYQQLPIGKMEIVRNFKPATLRDYYHKWYRPDLQGIVIVGDFDVNKMEQKVKETFSDIPMPENVPERLYPEISDNVNPKFVYFADKEFPFTMISVMFKSDRTPLEMRNTVEFYVTNNVIFALIADMVNERLSDFAKDPQCDYTQSSLAFENYMVSKTKTSMTLQTIAKNNAETAFAQAMEIMARALKNGFTETEFTRAKDKLLARYEARYNERNNIDNSELGNELCIHFIDNLPLIGAEEDYQMMQQMLMMIPLDAINQTAPQLFEKENQVVLVCEPGDGSAPSCNGDNMITLLQNKINQQYEAYAEEVISEPLIEKLPKPGKINQTQEGDFGTTQFILSNGAKVIVKPTVFKNDEILFEAIMKGGKSSFDVNDSPYVMLAEDAFESSKLGNFDSKTLAKYLAGKNVELKFEMGDFASTFKGSSTVKDLPTMMELLYSSFTALNPDRTTYDVQMDQLLNILKTVMNNPNMIFRRRVMEIATGNNPMLQQMPTPELVRSGDYEKELHLIKNLTSNAADWTFIFTGNVNADTLKPLIEQYIATLPSKGKSRGEPAKLNDMDLVNGQVKESFKQPMDTPGTSVYMVAHGSNIPYSVANNQKIEILGAILADIYLQTLREEEGGTYSPFALGAFNPNNGRWQIMTVFQTSSEKQQQLIERAKKEFANLLKNGASPELFNKAREAAKKQYEINVKTNQYWLDNLATLQFGIDNLSGHQEAIDNLTVDEFNQFISTLYDGENFIEIVMEGVAQ